MAYDLVVFLPFLTVEMVSIDRSLVLNIPEGLARRRDVTGFQALGGRSMALSRIVFLTIC